HGRIVRRRVRTRHQKRRSNEEGLIASVAKKVRVHELAKELGLTNKEALDLCIALGIDAKSHSSSIEDAQGDRVRRRAERDGLIRAEQPQEPAAGRRAGRPPAKKAAAATEAPTDGGGSVAVVVDDQPRLVEPEVVSPEPVVAPPEPVRVEEPVAPAAAAAAATAPVEDAARPVVEPEPVAAAAAETHADQPVADHGADAEHR